MASLDVARTVPALSRDMACLDVARTVPALSRDMTSLDVARTVPSLSRGMASLDVARAVPSLSRGARATRCHVGQARTVSRLGCHAAKRHAAQGPCGSGTMRLGCHAAHMRLAGGSNEAPLAYAGTRGVQPGDMIACMRHRRQQAHAQAHSGKAGASIR